MKRIVLSVLLLNSLLTTQLTIAQAKGHQQQTTAHDEHSQMPELELHDDHEEHEELLDNFEVEEMSPLMEWVAKISSEVVAGLMRSRRAFVAFLLRVKNYVVK